MSEILPNNESNCLEKLNDSNVSLILTSLKMKKDGFLWNLGLCMYIGECAGAYTDVCVYNHSLSF